MNNLKSFKCMIIVCAYNEENNIERCLNSIFNSICKAEAKDMFSVMCVDNSSVDNTSLIVKNMCSNHENLNYLKIKHDYLCVSRNSYKFSEGFDYISYVDADGFVDIDYIAELMGTIINSKPDIISGPVREAKIEKINPFWELFYNCDLYLGNDYLIGANMIFKTTLLEQVNGFPSVFEVRGDESSLMLKINMSCSKYCHIFNDQLITYNNFTQSKMGFISTQFTDGKRSYQISKIRMKRHLINVSYRFLSLILLFLFLMTFFLNIYFAFFCLASSVFPAFYRLRFFYKSIFKSLFSNFSIKMMFTTITIITSKFVFDLGFIYEFFKFYRKNKLDISLSRTPKILEKL